MAAKGGCMGIGRRAIGVSLVATTVLLWTLSSFLFSTIFADDSYSKPYFVTYLNTTAFTIFLPLRLLGYLRPRWRSVATSLGSSSVRDQSLAEESESLVRSDSQEEASSGQQRNHGSAADQQPLTLRETVSLALQFCFLWFAANFFQAKGLGYTSVASSTILATTSSVWTLGLGAWLQVEAFSLRKLLGVFASLLGIAIIAFGDVSGDSDEHRGAFPHKSPTDIAMGDIMALASAALYGLYTTLLKKKIHDESRIDMLLFLGFVGLANTLLVWPGLLVLHFSGWESFALPPTQQIWKIVVGNAFVCIFGDLTWAYAVLYTSPLVVTIGLSLSIPLSIIGQFFLNRQSATISYWFGAVIVFSAFIFINKESKVEEEPMEDRRREE